MNLPRDISYCYGGDCSKRKTCERWIGNLNIPKEGAWISVAAFDPEEEKEPCFLEVWNDRNATV